MSWAKSKEKQLLWNTMLFLTFPYQVLIEHGFHGNRNDIANWFHENQLFWKVNSSQTKCNRYYIQHLAEDIKHHEERLSKQFDTGRRSSLEFIY